MAMELTHHFTVPASLDDAWAAFNDLERIGGCLPGATITSVDGDDFTGSVKVKLGPISLQYNGTGSYVERDEAARRVVIKASGKDKRGNGTASVTITATLAAQDQQTAVDVVSDLGLTGKPAQFGRGIMQDVSDKLLGMFINCVRDKLSPAQTDPQAETGSQTDAETEVATEPRPGDTWVHPDTERKPASAAQDGTDTAPDSADHPGQLFPRADDPRPESASAKPAPTQRPSAKQPPAAALAPQSGPRSAEPAPKAELDFLSTVAPVVAQRYAKPAVAIAGGLLVFALLRRLLRGRG